MKTLTLPDTAQRRTSEHHATASRPWDDPDQILLGDGVIHTEPGTNGSPSQDGPCTPAATGESKDPALDDGLLTAAEVALQHPMELNRHRTELLRIAADPAIACSLFLLLTYLTASEGEVPTAEHPEDMLHMEWWLDRYSKRNLVEPGDAKALDTAMYRIAWWASGSPPPLTDDEFDLIARNPRALVRAAYALARDLTEPRREDV